MTQLAAVRARRHWRRFGICCLIMELTFDGAEGPRALRVRLRSAMNRTSNLSETYLTRLGCFVSCRAEGSCHTRSRSTTGPCIGPPARSSATANAGACSIQVAAGEEVGDRSARSGFERWPKIAYRCRTGAQAASTVARARFHVDLYVPLQYREPCRLTMTQARGRRRGA
jgi:hypothetical protein